MQVTLGEALSVLAWLGTLLIGMFGLSRAVTKAEQNLKDLVSALQVALTKEITKLDTELKLLGQSQGTESQTHKDRLHAVERAVDECGRDTGKLANRMHEVELQLARLQAAQHTDSGMFSKAAVQTGDSAMSPATRRPAR